MIKLRMGSGLLCLCLLVVAPGYAQLEPITPVEAARLVEYRCRFDLDGIRPIFDQVGLERESERLLYRASGRAGSAKFEALVDARTARVLSISRDGHVVYQWQGPKVVAHRGSVKFAPENTIPAFEAAIRMGADLIEIDVRQTRDGRLVIIHDETVDRTSDGIGKVADLTLAQLKELDAGSWFGPQFTGTRIPTLREALAVLSGKALPDIDFKAGDPEKLVTVLREEGLLDQVTFYCGDWNLLEQTRQLTNQPLWRPTVPVGLAGLPTVIGRWNPPIVNIDWEQFTERLVREVHLSGRKSFLNTMQQDTEWGMKRAIETAPDYVQSDHLDVLLRLLREHGLRD